LRDIRVSKQNAVRTPAGLAGAFLCATANFASRTRWLRDIYSDNNQMIKEALVASHLARAKEAEQMAEKTKIKPERENWLKIAQCFRQLADLAR